MSRFVLTIPDEVPGFTVLRPSPDVVWLVPDVPDVTADVTADPTPPTTLPAGWTSVGYTSDPGAPEALERKKPLERRTPIAPGKPLEGRGSLRRTPMTRDPQTGLDRGRSQSKPAPKRRADRPPRVVSPSSGPTPATRVVVLDRDRTVCARCEGTLDGPFGYSLQHRVARQMGGRAGPLRDYLNSPANLVALCGSGTTGCHGWVELHPDTAQRYGYSVPSWADPATWPIYHSGQWRMLLPDGRLEATLLGLLDRDWFDAGDASRYPGIRRLDVA